MTAAFAVLLVAHGLLHLIGVAKAFRLATLPQLVQPVAPAVGALWFAAAVLLVASAGAIYLWPRWWWVWRSWPPWCRPSRSCPRGPMPRRVPWSIWS